MSERPTNVLSLFQRTATLSPERIALLDGDRSFTYTGLRARAGRIAARLQQAGAGPDRTVGLCLERSPELISSVLGILKSGAAYAPIDPAYPADRIALMLEDAQPPVVITDRAHQHLFKGSKAAVLLVEDLDPDLTPNSLSQEEGASGPATPENLCYVLFTSGSTGRPKGVAMHHAPLINLIQWQCRTSVLKEGDRTLQFAPISFDVSFQELFTTFAQGGTLVLITDEDRLNSTQLLRKIIAQKINRIIVPFVALQYLAEAVERTGEVPTSLKEVFTSGEQLKITPAVANFFKQLPGCRFCNQYGPTEGHVVSELELKGDPSTWPPLPNIGKPIDDVKLYVLDERMKPVKKGEEGELYLGGACVAKGYIGRDDLTAERFLPDPFITAVTPSAVEARMYKTGDRAAELPNGEIDYKGRIDGQVKVRGYRIELGEVEVALEKHASIEQAVANVREDRPGLKRLIGYYVAKHEVSVNDLRKHLASLLPDYMVPSAFVAVKELPRTPSGKIDRKALPAPDVKRPELDVAFAAPQSAVQKTLANVWADLLGIDRVGIDDNFFDLGGNSLLSIQSVAQLEGHGLKLPIVKLYQHPTIKACSAFLEGNTTSMSPAEMAKGRVRARDLAPQHDVAIIGMSGRFPGAANVEELWKNLLDKKNSISRWSKDEIDPSIPDAVKNDPDYVAARGVITDADKFDAGFFGVNPRVAALMDPQQRVFLETAWAALEDAAYDPAQFAGLIGVYAGMGNNTYFTRNVIGHPELIEQVGDFAVMTANEKDYIATRLAFEFDLRGPALSIHTACSTSLVAIAQAFKALRDGDCDMALAGGIALTVPFNSGIVYNEGGMYSPDGSTRTFDANGKGTSFSDGVGIVVLKRLDDATRDNDHIYATIKGAALNNDGSDKASFTAPSVRGQAEVIAMAQADAGVTPDRITYVETHGTATPLGDPIEVEALTLAFKSNVTSSAVETHHCAIGSIKSNIGHLTAAAGVAGVIKTALALKEERIPSNVGFETPNPSIDFANSPFRVASDNIAWPRTSTPRIAGVSSFGVGGTNAHVILAEPPLMAASSTSRSKQLFLLSAKSKTSLDAMTDNLSAWLEAHPNASLADAAFTLQAGRRHFRHRRLIVGGSHGEVIEAIANKDTNLIGTRELHESAPGVVFMFPGQGSQYVNMGRDLHASEPVFAQHFDQCCQLFSKELGVDLKAIIFPKAGEEEQAAGQLKQTVYTQASLFTMHYSLAKLWMHWGITPDAMMGHSIGEFAAGCLAGVFSLEDAVKLVANRGRMMQELPGGSMLSVRAAEEDVAMRLPDGCSIAANNGPQLCVVSGPHEPIAKFSAELEKEGITCKLLVTSHAFHSPMMDAIVAPYKKVVESMKLSAPRIPIVSTVTAQWMKDEEATSPKYWTDHLRATVRFAQAVRFAWTDANRVMLEVGPRITGTTLARQQSTDPKKQAAVSSLSDHAGNGNELAQLLKAVGGLWQSGVLVDWNKFYEREQRHRISLPTYAFERVRHWVDPVAMVADGGRPIASTAIEAPVPNGADANLSPKDALIARIKQLLEESSGLELAEASPEETFLEMGLDSLFLTQVATSLSKKFGVKISFRQLNEELPNLDKLADFILPHVKEGGTVASVVKSTGKDAGVPLHALEDAPELKKVFGAQARISKEKVDDMTPQQRAWFDAFVERYVAKTAKSKAFTQENRKPMADPRVVTGFKPQTKELVYQVVVDKSKGCHLWDIDGNEYIDILSGFGSSMFGYMPDFIREACHKQLDQGIEIGPMHPLAAEVSKLLCELTGAERAAVCNTGSEAVLGAMRMARTVTGRSLIIAFSGSYHGINDEVIIRGSKSKKSYPGAPGIMPQAVENMLILDYGTPESLEIIKQRCHEAAAVLVEPVQSRRMEFRPVDFLREVRRITQENGAALIFDEVITGFRMHPNGAQGLFGIQADIGTYGKVIGGGMPIGAMIGKSEWMDALDGGYWQFGDDSVPPAGVTYFAGTFVRHPLTMAAMKAVLVHMKEEGPALQERLNDLTEGMVDRVNGLFDKYVLPYRWVTFGSAFKTKYDESVNYTELFFLLMRYHGVHVLDFPHFLTTAHTAADVEKIIAAVEKTCVELRASGFMPERTYPIERVNRVLNGHSRKLRERVIKASEPPVPNARLGRTHKGDPAWFVPDPQRQGKYLMLMNEDDD
jgi:amino acid adenylation domain-containing protein